jgi:hypothetical protein
MAVSYISKPIAPGVIPQQIPIELIAQVAAEKQNKYDNVLTSVLAQYNNILSLDTSAGSNEITEEYNNLMNQSTKDLESLVKLDLMNPDNYSKVEAVFNPILQDTGIMTAVADTRNYTKQKSIIQSLLLKGSDKYSAENVRYLDNQVQENRQMSKDEYMSSRNSTQYTLYKDVPKKIQDQLLKLPEVKSVSQKIDGAWIVTLEKGETKPIEEMMRYIQLDADDLAQAKINAWSEAPNTPGEFYVEKNIKII